MFDNVNEAEFHATEYDKILAVISQEGEKLPVCNECNCNAILHLYNRIKCGTACVTFNVKNFVAAGLQLCHVLCL